MPKVYPKKEVIRGYLLNSNDTRCEYHDNCFTCPFPECKKGDEAGKRYHKRQMEKKKMENTHNLRTTAEDYEEIINERKAFEIRLNDRNYKVGDTVILWKMNENDERTGEATKRTITYVDKDTIEGFTIMSLGIRGKNATWIEVDVDEFECSKCSYKHHGSIDTLTRRCPDCGKRMLGTQRKLI